MAMGPIEHVVVTGLMGAGKTTVGRELAETARLGVARFRRRHRGIDRRDRPRAARSRGRRRDASPRGGPAPRRAGVARTERHQRRGERDRGPRRAGRDGDAGRRRRLAPRPAGGPGRTVRLGRRASARLRRPIRERSWPSRPPVASRCSARSAHTSSTSTTLTPDEVVARALRTARLASARDRPDDAHPRRRHRDRRQPRAPVRRRVAGRRRGGRDLRVGQHRCAPGRHQHASRSSSWPAGPTSRSRWAARSPLVRALETTPETHGPQGLGHAELPPPTRADVDASRGRPHPRRGAPTAGRDHARHARPADQPRDRRPARAGPAPACSRATR